MEELEEKGEIHRSSLITILTDHFTYVTSVPPCLVSHLLQRCFGISVFLDIHIPLSVIDIFIKVCHIMTKFTFFCVMS